MVEKYDIKMYAICLRGGMHSLKFMPPPTFISLPTPTVSYHVLLSDMSHSFSSAQKKNSWSSQTLRYKLTHFFSHSVQLLWSITFTQFQVSKCMGCLLLYIVKNATLFLYIVIIFAINWAMWLCNNISSMENENWLVLVSSWILFIWLFGIV